MTIAGEGGVPIVGTLEENWEVPTLVTAEAVFGIGFPPQRDQEGEQEKTDSAERADHASD